MGIDNTYGTLGLRPGVCTSTSRPGSPYDGQVIYETNTGLTLVWNGSTWKPISTTSITASDGYLQYQTSWTSATYDATWTTYASEWGPAAYYRTNDGMVHLRGLVKRTSGSGTTVFTLPAGYRPPHKHLLMTVGSGGIARVDVGTDGAVVFVSSLSGTVSVTDWLSLNDLKFSVVS